MNITSKVWNFTKTGTKAHAFGEDGTALCRTSIKAPATQMMTKEEARKTVLHGPGLSFCETCEGRFQSILNVEAFDTLAAEEAPAGPVRMVAVHTGNPVEYSPRHQGDRLPYITQAGCRLPRKDVGPAAPVTPVLKIAKVKPEIAPEVIEALAWLRKGWDGDNSERAIMALDTLDNAGVFAAIDAAARYDAVPVRCTCPASRVSFPGDLSGIHTEGCPAAPAPELCGGVDRHGNRCTRPVQHLGYCFEGPATQYDVAPAPTEVQTGSDEWHRLMGEALAQTPLYAPRAAPAPTTRLRCDGLDWRGDRCGLDEGHTTTCMH